MNPSPADCFFIKNLGKDFAVKKTILAIVLLGSLFIDVPSYAASMKTHVIKSSANFCDQNVRVVMTLLRIKGAEGNINPAIVIASEANVINALSGAFGHVFVVNRDFEITCLGSPAGGSATENQTYLAGFRKALVGMGGGVASMPVSEVSRTGVLWSVDPESIDTSETPQVVTFHYSIDVLSPVHILTIKEGKKTNFKFPLVRHSTILGDGVLPTDGVCIVWDKNPHGKYRYAALIRVESQKK